MKKPNETQIKAIKIITAVVGIAAILTVAIYALFKNIFSPDGEGEAFRELVKAHPVLGVLILTLACVVQVIVAFIPGELLEQTAGYLFGPWYGALICFIGNMIGSVLVLLIVHKFGKKLVYMLVPKEKIDEIGFLKDTKRRNFLTFLLFLIPGTPKDLLTYAIGITDMSLLTYFLLTSFARIPSIIMSTVSGNWLADLVAGREVDGLIMKLVIWNAAAIVICIVGYIIYRVITKKRENKKNNEEEK